MTEVIRHIQIDAWIFEVKSVRALQVKDYGEPYSAIANISINGDTAHIDGLMTKEGDCMTDDDIKSFSKYCQQLQIKKTNLEYYENECFQLQTIKDQSENEANRPLNKKVV
jgi:hypothetical protein